MITIDSIGQTWEKRDISLITLDARKFVNSEAFKQIPQAEKPKAKEQPAANNSTTNNNTQSAVQGE